MGKKLISACMALAAFAAFAVMPATSSALTVTEPTGTALVTPVNVLGTNVGNSNLFTSIGTVECSTDALTGSLTNNNAATIKGTITSASFKGTASEERCTGPLGATTVITTEGNGVPWCVEAKESGDVAEIRGNSCANASRPITFVLKGAGLTCRYTRTESVKGTFTTDTPAGSTQDLVIHIPRSATGSNFTREEVSTFGCPASGEFEASFTLETDEATVKPLYAS
jgi:hypothetical protein